MANHRLPARREDGGQAAQPSIRARAEMVLARDVPGLTRVFASSYWRTLSWTAETAVNTGLHVVRRGLSGENPLSIIQNTTSDLRAMAAHLLGLEPDENQLAARKEAEKGTTTAELRARGAELLNQSADVNFDEDMHPAYARILSEMAPDEARILRLFVHDGPQPTVDVRTNRPLGIGSELVASGLSMIGEHAGCRNVDRTNAYLNNLFRLGLVWFSRETVDPQRYQLVEAQPKVLDAVRRAGRAPKIVHRSIHLTPFGADFCAVCLPLDTPGAIEGSVVEQPEFRAEITGADYAG